MLYVLLATRIS